MGLEPAADAPGEIFGAEQRSTERPDRADALDGLGELLVVVEGDDVGVGENELGDPGAFRADPFTGEKPSDREWLGGIHLAAPLEGMLEQDEADCLLSSPPDAVVTFPISRLVVEVPAQDARVVLESADHSGDVGLERLVLGDVLERVEVGRLDPSRVVSVRHGVRLLAQLGERSPTAVEQDEHGRDAVLVGNAEKPVDAFQETFTVLLPEHVVEVNADGVHADAGRPAELPVDRFRVKGVGLPHLELVDRGGWREVASHQPRLLVIPGVGLLLRPPAGQGDIRAGGSKTRESDQDGEKSGE